MEGVLFKSKKVRLTLLIILLITLIIGSTYALWKITKIQTGLNKLASNCYDVEFSEQDNIVLEEAIPILNSEGEKLTPYTLSIKNTCDAETKYQVNLEVTDNSLNSKYIDLKVNSDDYKILNKYATSEGILEENLESYKIGEGHLRKNQVINYEIRLWMDEDISADETEAMNKSFRSKVTVEAVAEKTEGKYKEDILNGADPVLKEKLIPVVIDSKGGVTRADENQKWYNYSNREWANAVILNDDVETPKVGESISEDSIESYFVWMPRYKYKIFSDTRYASLSEEIEDRVQTIDVIFENKDTQASSGNTKGKWLTHPAFTSFETNGIWVGKFETGYKDAENTAGAQQNPKDEEAAKTAAANVIIKPNVYSWRSIQVAKAYVVGINYEESLNSHMMKNTEWGAVAYLSQSIYGSRQEVRINNNSSNLTGYAAIHQPTIGYTGTNELCSTHSETCNEFVPATKGEDGTLNTQYFNEDSVKASTTNNYTGIFDMSGGAWEYMMSGMEDSLGSNTLSSGRHNVWNSGFNGNLTCPNCNSDSVSGVDSKITEVENGIELPDDERYYDIYTYSVNDKDNSHFIFGDATGEMGPFKNIKYTGTTEGATTQSRNINSWYNDDGLPVISSSPWVIRGGFYDHGTEAGLFSFNKYYGQASPACGFRLVLAF